MNSKKLIYTLVLLFSVTGLASSPKITQTCRKNLIQDSQKLIAAELMKKKNKSIKAAINNLALSQVTIIDHQQYNMDTLGTKNEMRYVTVNIPVLKTYASFAFAIPFEINDKCTLRQAESVSINAVQYEDAYSLGD